MKKIKCVIIDHEPYTASMLETYMSELDALLLVGTFYNPIDALMYLQHHHVDLIFIDIMLPKVTGEAFLKLVPSRPKIIFLAGRRQRWEAGADENVLDCLVKPITYEDFLASIDRCYSAIPPAVRRALPRKARRSARSRGPFVYMFSRNATVKIFLNEVLYIESVRDYAKVKTADKEIIVYQGMAAIESRLASKGFLRIHRSFLVATAKITAFTECMVEIGVHILPVSVPYRGRLTRLIRANLEKA